MWLVTQVNIPPSVLNEQPIFVLALLSALGTVWALYLKERSDNKAAVEAMHAQQLINVKSEASLQFKDYVIEQLKEDRDKCESRLERCTDSSPPSTRSRR